VLSSVHYALESIFPVLQMLWMNLFFYCIPLTRR